jgi:tRNA dimethylallyltransferase
VSDAGTWRALVICGPTGSGKSSIAVRVALALGGEIVNADSRQVYRGLVVGTASPTPDQLAAVPHHLYGFVDPAERYSAGAYRSDALRAIGGIAARGRLPIVVGGTGLYIEALAGTMPLDRPIADDAVRARVQREAASHPNEFLRAWLETVDPAAARRIPPGDRYRTLRALEATLASKSLELPVGARANGSVRMRTAVVDVPRAVLVQRIEQRVRRMFDDGLIDEARRTHARYPNSPALTGIGYLEALAYVHGEMTHAEMIAAATARTVRYAKRQRTWFRRMRDAVTVEATDESAAAHALIGLARESRATA